MGRGCEAPAERFFRPPSVVTARCVPASEAIEEAAVESAMCCERARAIEGMNEGRIVRQNTKSAGKQKCLSAFSLFASDLKIDFFARSLTSTPTPTPTPTRQHHQYHGEILCLSTRRTTQVLLGLRHEWRRPNHAQGTRQRAQQARPSPDASRAQGDHDSHRQGPLGHHRL